MSLLHVGDLVRRAGAGLPANQRCVMAAAAAAAAAAREIGHTAHNYLLTHRLMLTTIQPCAFAVLCAPQCRCGAACQPCCRSFHR